VAKYVSQPDHRPLTIQAVRERHLSPLIKADAMARALNIPLGGISPAAATPFITDPQLLNISSLRIVDAVGTGEVDPFDVYLTERPAVGDGGWAAEGVDTP
jgi:hypothetical protein